MLEKDQALKIIDITQELKAEDVRLYDLQNRSSITDYILICSGRSQGHVRGIADRIVETLKISGVYPLSIEGHREGSWVLIDYNVVIVHIFHPETRAHYNLEELLQGYPREDFPIPNTPFSLSPDEGAAPA